jgi:hypothetical protein
MNSGDTTDATTALEKLAAELGARRYTTRLLPTGGQASAKPSLQVTNPLAEALTETVCADGGWYWWSWAERIGPITDVSKVADAIGRVLSEWRSST